MRLLCVRRRLKLRAPHPTIEARTRSIVWGQQSPPTLLTRVHPFVTFQYAILSRKDKRLVWCRMWIRDFQICVGFYVTSLWTSLR